MWHWGVPSWNKDQTRKTWIHYSFTSHLGAKFNSSTPFGGPLTSRFFTGPWYLVSMVDEPWRRFASNTWGVFVKFFLAQIISKVDPEPIAKNRVIYIPPKTKMDTQNDGLEKVTLLKSGHFWYQFVRFLGWFHPLCLRVSGVISPRNQWSYGPQLITSI